MNRYRFSKKQILEFINKDGTLINKNVPDYINPDTTSKSTTDEFIRASTQKRGIHAFFRAYGEADLPYNDVADKYQEDPESFFMFLKSKGEEDQFGQYFKKREDDQQADAEIIDPESEKIKSDVEDMSNANDASEPHTSVTPPKSAVYEMVINEIKTSDKIISGKLDKLLEYFGNSYNNEQREAIAEYCKKVLNGK